MEEEEDKEATEADEGETERDLGRGEAERDDLEREVPCGED